MVWDLRRALLKKGEFESARLADFEFRQRARALRILASLIGEDPGALALRVAEQNDEKILTDLASHSSRPLAELRTLHARCWAEAREQLIGEIGDPTPHRLG